VNPVITGDKAQWPFSRTAAPRHAREVQTSASKEPTGPPASEATSSPTAVEAARRVVLLGGMFSTELGIDLGKGERELTRWFLAAMLFGTRISATIAMRTFSVLDKAGVTMASARHASWDALVELLDAGGYTRYDYRTATRLQELSEVLDTRYGGRVSAIAHRARTPAELEGALDALPGWGPVTVGVFLRELRGVWDLADPPLGALAADAGRHLQVLSRGGALEQLRAVATTAGIDVRDLECALVRLALAHHRRFADCPGGRCCAVLAGVAPVGS